MSAPVRFLAIVVLGWAGVRTVTLGAVPGFTVSYAKEMPADTLPPLIKPDTIKKPDSLTTLRRRPPAPR